VDFWRNSYCQNHESFGCFDRRKTQFFSAHRDGVQHVQSLYWKQVFGIKMNWTRENFRYLKKIFCISDHSIGISIKLKTDKPPILNFGPKNGKFNCFLEKKASEFHAHGRKSHQKTSYFGISIVTTMYASIGVFGHMYAESEARSAGFFWSYMGRVQPCRSQFR